MAHIKIRHDPVPEEHVALVAVDVLKVYACSTCRMNFAVSDIHSSGLVYCPSGHYQSPNKTTQRRRWWSKSPPSDVAVTELITLSCAGCCRPFAVPVKFDEASRRNHSQFRCPSGHANIYPATTTEQAAEAALTQMTVRATKAEVSLREANRRAADLAKQVTELQQRVAEAEQGYGMVTRERRALTPD